VTKNEFYNLYRDTTPALVAAAASGAPPTMPSSLLNPVVGKMDITSDVYDEVMSGVDKQLIMRALETSGGRIREAARRLGLARNTLKSKIQKYAIVARE
jgi:DNA-binding NtrC family response regulator